MVHNKGLLLVPGFTAIHGLPTDLLIPVLGRPPVGRVPPPPDAEEEEEEEEEWGFPGLLDDCPTPVVIAFTLSTSCTWS